MYKLTPNTAIIRLIDHACIPNDPANTDYAQYLQWLSEGNTPEPADIPDPRPILERAVQNYLDDFAQTRGYSGIMSACSYATSASPRFGPEGRNAVALRDSVWESCYTILSDVQAGTRAVPTVESLIAELPALVWPV